MRGQRIIELAAIFQRQHGLEALRMAEARRDEHVPRSEGFRLWDAITRELRQLLSHQLNQPLNCPNAALHQETTSITIAKSSGSPSGEKRDADGK
jgi:hypothetical protein